MNKLNFSIKSLIILASISYAGLANAHFFFGGVLVNKTTQVFTVSCPTAANPNNVSGIDTSFLEVRVLDGSVNNGVMSVTIFKDGNADTESDLVQGDGGYGAFAKVTAGPGVYHIIPSQTAAVFGTYFLDYHCRTAGGAETTPNPGQSGEFAITQN